MRITIDTNILSADALLSRCRKLGFEIAVVSVTEREIEGTRFEVNVKLLQRVSETAVFGESRWGEAKWGDEETKVNLNSILDIISNGSFPSERNNLTEGQLRQLRDAMILEAHIREGRDIFVSDDQRAFVKKGRREALQERFDTRIMTKEEFTRFCNERFE